MMKQMVYVVFHKCETNGTDYLIGVYNEYAQATTAVQHYLRMYDAVEEDEITVTPVVVDETSDMRETIPYTDPAMMVSAMEEEFTNLSEPNYDELYLDEDEDEDEEEDWEEEDEDEEPYYEEGYITLSELFRILADAVEEE